MPDSLSTLASNLPQTIATVTAAFGVIKPFLTKILGPAAEELGELNRDYVKSYRARVAAARLARAQQLTEEAGIEPQAVPLKLLLPWKAPPWKKANWQTTGRRY